MTTILPLLLTISENTSLTVGWKGLDGSFTLTHEDDSIIVRAELPDCAGRTNVIYAENVNTEAVDIKDVNSPPAVYAEESNIKRGFSHRIIAYGDEGPWQGYDESSIVETPYGTFMSFVDTRYGGQVRTACLGTTHVENVEREYPAPIAKSEEEWETEENAAAEEADTGHHRALITFVHDFLENRCMYWTRDADHADGHTSMIFDDGTDEATEADISVYWHNKTSQWVVDYTQPNGEEVLVDLLGHSTFENVTQILNRLTELTGLDFPVKSAIKEAKQSLYGSNVRNAVEVRNTLYLEGWAVSEDDETCLTCPNTGLVTAWNGDRSWVNAENGQVITAHTDVLLACEEIRAYATLG